MNETALAIVENQLGISKETFKNLETYDDYVNFYVQLEEVASGFSWIKSDLLLEANKKMGDKSLKKFSREVQQPYSTIANYIRVARAFPVEKRDLAASFTLHFQASFADSYSEEQKSFIGEERFEWLSKAVDEGMSSRKLAAEIQKQKERDLIRDGDELSIAKQETKEVLQDIQRVMGAFVKRANEGQQDYLNKLKAIREFVYGQS